MRKLFLAMSASFLVVAALTAPASATTCSGRYRTCLRICPHGEHCVPGCHHVFAKCLRTGCWASMIEHKCGYRR